MPVSPPDTLEKIQGYCDELVCLSAPPELRAVGQFYRDFNLVSDDEAIDILKRRQATA